MELASPTLRKMAGAKSLNRVKFKDEKEEGVKPVKVGDNEALAECELYWAHQLRAYVDNGGNAHSIKKEFGLG